MSQPEIQAEVGPINLKKRLQSVNVNSKSTFSTSQKALSVARTNQIKQQLQD